MIARFFRSGSLRAELLRGGGGSVLIKITGIILQLATAVVFARVLGAEGFGVYSFVFALVTVLSIPAQAGLANLVIRETARAYFRSDWPLLKGLWTWAGKIAFWSSVIIILCALAFVTQFDILSYTETKTFYWALILIPFLALGALRGAALKGLRHVVLGNLPEQVLWPAFTLIFVLLAFWTQQFQPLNPPSIMAFTVLASGFSFIVGAALLSKLRPPSMATVFYHEYEASNWFRSMMPLALTQSMGLINNNADLIMLGFMTNNEDVGMYRVGAYGSLLLIFGLQAVNMVVSPYFARMYEKSDHRRMQRLVTRGAQAAFFVAVPLFVVFVVFGELLLSSTFGLEFSGAYAALIILSVGQLVNAAFGPVALLLNMSGHYNIVASGMLFSSIINISLNLLMIPRFGIEGAAFATGFSYIFWNLFLFFVAKSRLGVRAFVL